MGSHYQKTDNLIMDYELWDVSGILSISEKFYIRGPKIENFEHGYGLCIGSAHTFGRFSSNPYPKLLSNYFKMPVFNFGISGASPSFFIKNHEIIKFAKEAKFICVEIMSARGESNNLFLSPGGKATLVHKKTNKKFSNSNKAYDFSLSMDNFEDIQLAIEESRKNYIENMTSILKNFQKNKTILVYLSSRIPKYEVSFKNARGLLGEFPQFVNDLMINQLINKVGDTISVISSEGKPNFFKNRFTGEYCSIYTDFHGVKFSDNYYASPEMHFLAFENLKNVVAKLI